MANNPRISPSLQTSQIFRLKGQRSLFYPDVALTPEHCVTIKNVNFTEQRTVDVKAGSTKFHADAVAGTKPITGLFQATFPDGTVENIETMVLRERRLLARQKKQMPKQPSAGWFLSTTRL